MVYVSLFWRRLMNKVNIPHGKFDAFRVVCRELSEDTCREITLHAALNLGNLGGLSTISSQQLAETRWWGGGARGLCKHLPRVKSIQLQDLK